MCSPNAEPGTVFNDPLGTARIASLNESDWITFWGNLVWSFQSKNRWHESSGGFTRGGSLMKPAVFGFLAGAADQSNADPSLLAPAIAGTARFLNACAKLRNDPTHLIWFVEMCDRFCYRLYIKSDEAMGFLRDLLVQAAHSLGWPRSLLDLIQDAEAAERAPNPFLPHHPTARQFLADESIPRQDRLLAILTGRYSPRRLQVLKPRRAAGYTEQDVADGLAEIRACVHNPQELTALLEPMYGKAKGAIRRLIRRWLESLRSS